MDLNNISQNDLSKQKRNINEEEDEFNNKNEDMSDWLKSLDTKMQSIGRKKKSTDSITHGCLCNKDIFSFNKENLDFFEKALKKKSIQPQPITNANSNSSTTTTTTTTTTSAAAETAKQLAMVKYIMEWRRDFLKTIIEDLEDREKILAPYGFSKEVMVDHIMKFEMLGVTEIENEFPIFCYYIGKDNKDESFDDVKNWKILNTNLFTYFHSSMARTTKEMRQNFKIYYTSIKKKEDVLLDSLYFSSPDDIIRKKVSSLLYSKEQRYMLNDSTVNKMLDKFNIKIPEKESKKAWPTTLSFDPRIIIKKLRPNKNTTESLHQMSNTSTTTTSSSATLKKPMKKIKNNKSKKNKNVLNNTTITVDMSIDNNGNDTTSIINNGEGDIKKIDITKEDWDRRKCIIPPNIQFYFPDLEELLNIVNKADIDNNIAINPTHIINAGILAVNPIGATQLAIKHTEEKMNLKYDENDGGNLFESMLSDEITAAYFKRELYQHLNAIIGMEYLMRKQQHQK